MCTGLLVFVVQQGDAPDQPAVPLPLNQPVPGYVDSSNPQARYRFVIEQPGPVTVAVTGDFDSYLELYQEDSRQPLMEDDDSGGNLDPLLTTALAPGSYVALVRAFTDGTQGSFVLTVEAPAEQGRQPQGPPAGLPVPAQTHRATVVETTGQAPVAAHTTCDVYITSAPAQNGLNCRVRVLCGGQVLYGRDGEGANSYGYNQCVVTGSPDGIQAVEAHDRGHRAHDGDPMMDLQTAQGRVTITDSNAAGHWSVTLQLTGPNGGNGPQTTT
jgi:hypothetical protein